MARLYLYKLTTDDGGAPCVHAGLLTLAICKPMIRTTAQVGDLLFGFAANRMNPGDRPTDNHLIYIARVDGRLSGRDYYGDERYAARTDCVYEVVGDGFAWRADARRHGPEDLVHDLGERPACRRAVVLASREFRYFGEAGSARYKDRFPAVRTAVERMGRGRRVNHGDALRRELLELKDWIWESPVAVDAGSPVAGPQALGTTDGCRRPAGRRAR